MNRGTHLDEGTGGARGGLCDNAVTSHVNVELESVHNLLLLVCVRMILLGPLAEVL